MFVLVTIQCVLCLCVAYVVYFVVGRIGFVCVLSCVLCSLFATMRVILCAAECIYFVVVVIV